MTVVMFQTLSQENLRKERSLFYSFTYESIK